MGPEVPVHPGFITWPRSRRRVAHVGMRARMMAIARSHHRTGGSPVAAEVRYAFTTLLEDLSVWLPGGLLVAGVLMEVRNFGCSGTHMLPYLELFRGLGVGLVAAVRVRHRRGRAFEQRPRHPSSLRMLR